MGLEDPRELEGFRNRQTEWHDVSLIGLGEPSLDEENTTSAGGLEGLPVFFHI